MSEHPIIIPDWMQEMFDESAAKDQAIADRDEVIRDIAATSPIVENNLHFRCVFCNDRSFGSASVIEHKDACAWRRAVRLT